MISFNIKNSVIFSLTLLTLGATTLTTCQSAGGVPDHQSQTSNQIADAYALDILIVISFKNDGSQHLIPPADVQQDYQFQEVPALWRDNFMIDVVHNGTLVCSWDPLESHAISNGLATGIIDESLPSQIELLRFFSIENLICCKIRFVGDPEEKFYFVGNF